MAKQYFDQKNIAESIMAGRFHCEGWVLSKPDQLCVSSIPVMLSDI